MGRKRPGHAGEGAPPLRRPRHGPAVPRGYRPTAAPLHETTSAQATKAAPAARAITSSKAMFSAAPAAGAAARAWTPRAARVPGALAPAAAAAAEAARYVALEKLRGVFADACAAAGCSAEPLLAFER